MQDRLSPIKAYPLRNYVASDNLLKLYQPQFFHLRSGATNNTTNPPNLGLCSKLMMIHVETLA